RDFHVTGVQTCTLPISVYTSPKREGRGERSEGCGVLAAANRASGSVVADAGGRLPRRGELVDRSAGDRGSGAENFRVRPPRGAAGVEVAAGRRAGRPGVVGPPGRLGVPVVRRFGTLLERLGRRPGGRRVAPGAGG